MPDEQNEGFVVRDRRRYLTEDDAPAAPTQTAAVSVPQSPVAAESGAFDDDATERNDLADGGAYDGSEDEQGGALPDVYSVLALFLGELRNLAWLRMGLVANPGTGQIERDMTQARIAIDTVAFLATKIEPVVPPEERLPLKALVSDLQVNFVEQSKRGA